MACETEKLAFDIIYSSYCLNFESSIEIDMLEGLEDAIPPPEHLPEEFSPGFSESENSDLEINLPDSGIDNTEFEINEEILNVDCVYIISLEHTEENLEKWE